MREGIAVGIVEMPHRPVKAGRPFHNKLLKGVGDTKLAVDHDAFAVSETIPDGLDQFGMTSHRHGAKIMTFYLNRRRRYHLR